MAGTCRRGLVGGTGAHPEQGLFLLAPSRRLVGRAQRPGHLKQSALERDQSSPLLCCLRQTGAR